MNSLWIIISGLTGLTGLFLTLFVRSAIANGKLRREIGELKSDVNVAKKQLDIAANHPDTPDSLAKRMRDGKL